jgi:hypothetical protein
MTSLVLRDLFLTTPATTRTEPATIGVLTRPGDAHLVGTALALATRSRSTIIAHWTGTAPRPPRSGPALAATRRLAQRLANRDLLATAHGRLVSISLPADPTSARTITERLLGSEPSALILVISGPRPPELELLLTRLDHLILAVPADTPSSLTSLLTTTITRPASLLHLPPTTPTSRFLTHLGLFLPPHLRTLATRALEDRDA